MGTADKDYFLDKEGNIAQDELSAATLLIRKGQEVPKEVADKYGIGKVAQSDEATDDTVEKKSAKPSANKSVTPTKNKGVK